MCDCELNELELDETDVGVGAVGADDGALDFNRAANSWCNASL